jgi:hypothetical protein
VGLNEEILELNKKLNQFVKQKEDLYKVLAVEEHKLKEIADTMTGEGLGDPRTMTPDQLTNLLSELSDKLVEEKDKLEVILEEAQKTFDQLKDLK